MGKKLTAQQYEWKFFTLCDVESVITTSNLFLYSTGTLLKQTKQKNFRIMYKYKLQTVEQVFVKH